MDIGKRIRDLRHKKKMTLKGLAQKTNLTISYLSQIERSLLTPSLKSLINISIALKVPVIWLFLEKPVPANPVTKKGQRKKIILPNSHVVYELLSPPDGTIEVLSAEMKPKQGEKDELVTHEGEECVYVIKGKLEIRLGEKTYFVEEGDSIYFQSNILHRFSNPTKKPLKLLVAAYPPSF